MAILRAWQLGCGSSTQSGSSRSQHQSGRYTSLDHGSREQGRPASDAVRPADLAQASGAFPQIESASPSPNAYWPVASFTHFVVKLAFAAPLSFLSCAAVPQDA